MVDSRTAQHAHLLRSIGERLKQRPVKQIIKQPGMRAVYRVTIFYHDRRALDSVATLYDRHTVDPELAIAYQGAFREKLLKYPVSRIRYEDFVSKLHHLRFDHLRDQPSLPQYQNVDLWLIERAAGTFVRSIIVAPETAQDVHGEIVNMIKTYLPEALRLIAQE